VAAGGALAAVAGRVVAERRAAAQVRRRPVARAGRVRGRRLPPRFQQRIQWRLRRRLEHRRLPKLEGGVAAAAGVAGRAALLVGAAGGVAGLAEGITWKKIC